MAKSTTRPFKVLERFAFFEECTLGQLLVGGKTLYVLELPWKDNQRSISCVPPGRYDVSMDTTTTSIPKSMGGRTWYLTGDTVSRHRGSKDRYAVAIHIGNTAKDIRGCLAPGLGWASMGGQMAVTQSRAAMLHLKRHLPQHFTLAIKNYSL